MEKTAAILTSPGVCAPKRVPISITHTNKQTQNFFIINPPNFFDFLSFFIPKAFPEKLEWVKKSGEFVLLNSPLLLKVLSLAKDLSSPDQRGC